jgi:hypothetical protein
MNRQICFAVLPVLALVGCDEVVTSKAEVAKIAAEQAAKAVAASKADAPADVKGRYQIVHPAPYFPAMVLLDTVTGQTWKPCTRGDLPGVEFTAWCEMMRAEYAVPPAKVAKQ